jgi:hypothetical protein
MDGNFEMIERRLIGALVVTVERCDRISVEDAHEGEPVMMIVHEDGAWRVVLDETVALMDVPDDCKAALAEAGDLAAFEVRHGIGSGDLRVRKIEGIRGAVALVWLDSEMADFGGPEVPDALARRAEDVVQGRVWSWSLTDGDGVERDAAGGHVGDIAACLREAEAAARDLIAA